MKLNILMIEDNLQNRYLASFLLEKAGHAVTAAPDGASGIALARQSRPDVILLDIQLPVMDGYSVASALRQIPSLHDTAIIAVTSFAMVGDREKALASGCNSYIEKPINTETFVTEIENLSLLSHSPQQAV